jgi:hypothetical protein
LILLLANTSAAPASCNIPKEKATDSLNDEALEANLTHFSPYVLISSGFGYGKRVLFELSAPANKLNHVS